jgi:hypothetical protein
MRRARYRKHRSLPKPETGRIRESASVADSTGVSRSPRPATLPAFLLFAAFGAGPTGAADALTPFYSFNHQPLAQIYGLPALGPARVLPAGVTDVQLAVNLASHYVSESRGDEQLTLDGETHRTTVLIRRGIGRGYEWGVELPYVSHSGGFLDGPIDSWHAFFGFPDGGRDQAPRDRLLYHYRREGVDLLHVDEARAGVGDVRLTGALLLTPDSRSAPVALRAQLKLPTGDSAALLGSGATDLSLWVSLACPDSGSSADGTWCLYGGGGIVLLGEGDVLAKLQHRQVGFASGGIVWQFLPAWSVKTQLDVHTPLYRDSELSPLGHLAAQWLLGLDYRHPGTRTFLEFGFTEDVALKTTPDVSFMLRWGMRYGL